MKQKATIEPIVEDGLENLIANMGTDLDKRASSRFTNRKQLSLDGSQEELNAMYRTDWITGKVVDIIPDDMTREWRTFTGEISPEQIKLLEEEENRLELSTKFNLAHKWARLYGTAFIVMSIDDGSLPEEPLNIDAVEKASLRHIQVIDRHRVSNADQIPIADPMKENFGMPEFYRFNETSVQIHHSRVIRFDGHKLPFDEFRRNNYYSDSIVDRLYETITNFNTVTSASASMTYESNVDVMKVKGLMNYLTSAEGEQIIRKRFTLANLLKSFNNTLLLDNEESFESKEYTFSGLPDLIDRFSKILSSASDIPATRLLGDSASGLSATGEGDMKNYYDKIRSLQKTEYKPRLDKFDMLMAKSIGIPDGADLSYEFNSLFQMSDQEKSTIEVNNANRDKAYYDMNIVTESMIAKELQQDGVYTNIDDDHIKALEEFENEIETNTIEGEANSESESEEEESEESELGKDA